MSKKAATNRKKKLRINSWICFLLVHLFVVIEKGKKGSLRNTSIVTCTDSDNFLPLAVFLSLICYTCDIKHLGNDILTAIQLRIVVDFVIKEVKRKKSRFPIHKKLSHVVLWQHIVFKKWMRTSNKEKGEITGKKNGKQTVEFPIF